MYEDKAERIYNNETLVKPKFVLFLEIGGFYGISRQAEPSGCLTEIPAQVISVSFLFLSGLWVYISISTSVFYPKLQ